MICLYNFFVSKNSFKGNIYGFQLDCKGDGVILPDEGEPLWTYTFRYGRFRWFYFPANPISLFSPPDCTFTRADGAETLTLTQQRRFPLPRFVLSRNGTPVCTLTQRSILWNKYALKFSNGELWQFHLPLFTTYFGGVSETGDEIQIQEWTKRMWAARREFGEIDDVMLCVIAAIHRERWRAS